MSEQETWGTSVYFSAGGVIEINNVVSQRVQEGVMLVVTKESRTYGFPLTSINYWTAS